MQVVSIYSHKDGEKFIRENRPQELLDIFDAVHQVNADSVLTKISHEASKPPLIFSPTELNNQLKNILCTKGWTQANSKGKKGFSEPRLYWNSLVNDFNQDLGLRTPGNNEFREMDGIKNKVGLEIQFGKYAFMGYDIFSKMPIFAKKQMIDCGIELVAMPNLIPNMSTGVSSYSQIVMDMMARGVADIDIPTIVVGISCTDDEWVRIKEKRELFEKNPQMMIDLGLVSEGRSGAKPGPK